MKCTKPVIGFLLVIFSISTGLEAYCQKAEPRVKIKNIIVYAEKNNALVSKKFKESEVSYDQQGNILEETYYKESRVTKHFKYQYDADGNKIREEEYDSSGKLKEYSEYKYQSGFRIEKVVYDPQKNIRQRKTYQYAVY
jgi:hypothetical protein